MSGGRGPLRVAPDSWKRRSAPFDGTGIFASPVRSFWFQSGLGLDHPRPGCPRSVGWVAFCTPRQDAHERVNSTLHYYLVTIPLDIPCLPCMLPGIIFGSWSMVTIRSLTEPNSQHERLTRPMALGVTARPCGMPWQADSAILHRSAVLNAEGVPCFQDSHWPEIACCPGRVWRMAGHANMYGLINTRSPGILGTWSDHLLFWWEEPLRSSASANA